jgi:hypothetical protein
MYNVKINKIRDALLLAEKNLILYLGLEDIETLSPVHEPVTIKHVTLGIFFSFNAYFRGEYQRMLNVQLQYEPPFFNLNVYYLNPLLKDIWLQFQKFLTTLENS